MEICVISKNSISLSARVCELEALGISSNDMDIPNITRLIRRNFDDAGLGSAGDLFIETYINSESVLIFARVSDKEESAFSLFRFSDFEDVVNVCALLDEKTPSRLIYRGGSYYLCIPSDYYTPFICEFGEKERFSSLRIAYLREHGKTVFDENAVSSVKCIFNL